MIINRLNPVFIATFISLIDLIWAFICKFMLTIDNYLELIFMKVGKFVLI